MTINVYTDASYFWQKDIAACGHAIINKGDVLSHSVIKVEKIKSVYHAEFYSICYGLQKAFLVKDVSVVNIYSDSESALHICKTKKIKSGFGLSMLFDEYLELIEIYEEYNIEVHFHKVKAHNGDYFNNMVDRSSRKYLREHLKNIK